MNSLESLYFSDNKYYHNSGYGDKGTAHSYLETYGTLFEPIKNFNLNILEIGIMNGHSLRLWRDYFPNSSILGVDIDQKCLQYKEDRVDVMIQDATTEGFANMFQDNHFDIIIDDGSHFLNHQLASHKFLYPKVKAGGLYIIEDILNIDSCYTIFKNLEPTEIIDNRNIKNEATDVIVYWRKK